MAVVSLTIAQIKECVMKLVDKAKVEMPKMPDKTGGLEQHYIAELFEKDGEQYIFAFHCTPPYEYGGDGLNKMMVQCHICCPSKSLESDIPIMYETKETVIEALDSEDQIKMMINKFEFLLQKTEEFDPDERSDFDFDD